MITIKRKVEQELRLIVGLSTVSSQSYATEDDIKANGWVSHIDLMSR